MTKNTSGKGLQLSPEHFSNKNGNHKDLYSVGPNGHKKKIAHINRDGTWSPGK